MNMFLARDNDRIERESSIHVDIEQSARCTRTGALIAVCVKHDIQRPALVGTYSNWLFQSRVLRVIKLKTVRRAVRFCVTSTLDVCMVTMTACCRARRLRVRVYRYRLARYCLCVNNIIYYYYNITASMRTVYVSIRWFFNCCTIRIIL